MTSPVATIGFPDPAEVYELVTLTLPVGTNRLHLSATLEKIRDFDTRDTILGCWTPDFGPQNRIVLLRRFECLDVLHEERQRLLMESDPFLPHGELRGLSMESFLPFPGLRTIESGAFGPLYEFRTYKIKIGGLAPTIRAWQKILPLRTALSPLITAMYAIDGPPRFIHIWAYQSYEERQRVRAEAFETKAWPAPGAPEWLDQDLRSESFTATKISALL